MNKRKTVVTIVINQKSPSTKEIGSYLASNIDELSKNYFIKIIYLSKKNYKAIKARSITNTPTMLVGKRKFESIPSIKDFFNIIDVREEPNLIKSPDIVYEEMRDEELWNKEDDDKDEAKELEKEFQKRQKAMERQRSANMPERHVHNSTKKRPEPKTISGDINEELDEEDARQEKKIQDTLLQEFNENSEGYDFEDEMEEYYFKIMKGM